MNRNHFCTGLILLVLAALCGCSEPPVPPGVQLAERQELELWRAGAAVYASEDYADYLVALEAGREHLRKERGRLRWFRDYAAVQREFEAVLARGEHLAAGIAERQRQQAGAARRELDELAVQLRSLRELAAELPDTRLTSRRLAQAEVRLAEGRGAAARGEHAKALEAAAAAEELLTPAIARVRTILGRYRDPEQLGAWRREVEAAIRASRSQGETLVVVSKLERRLTLYRAGRVVKSYPVGMGFHYLDRKLFGGDKATPEGSYRVTHKNPRSRFGQALLLDYPNAADRRRFKQARAAGQLPAGTRIGGLIELHGGGTEGLTDGCVALDDARMRELYAQVPEGAVVVIVGTLSPHAGVARALEALP